MSKSTSLVTNTTTAPAASNYVARSSLKMGDLYRLPDSRKGRVYMHTGVRTQPPSAGSSTGSHTVDGKVIVGWQSIIVRGTIAASEDGAVITRRGDKQVELIGNATITLNLLPGKLV